ncbi:hypothetical protein MKEN_01136200 [Mycena kentingensis (nom. inval.)]|nr:hypothetical protein MKEN_01136200 [Mycena kentingensis (nom. inval.)]
MSERWARNNTLPAPPTSPALSYPFYSKVNHNAASSEIVYISHSDCATLVFLCSRSLTEFQTNGRCPPFPPKEHCCPHCKWSYDRPYDLIRHLDTHLPPVERALASYHCTECNFRTLQRSNFMAHMRTRRHAGRKDLECSTCENATPKPAEHPRTLRPVLQHSDWGKRAARRRPRALPGAAAMTSSFRIDVPGLSPSPMDTSSSSHIVYESEPRWTPVDTNAQRNATLGDLIRAANAEADLGCAPSPIYGQNIPAHLFAGAGTLQPYAAAMPYSPATIDPRTMTLPSWSAVPTQPLLFNPATMSGTLDWFPYNPPQFMNEWNSYV